jgi:hypothetical protein
MYKLLELNCYDQRAFLENVDFIDNDMALAFMKHKSPAAFSATTAVSVFFSNNPRNLGTCSNCSYPPSSSSPPLQRFSEYLRRLVTLEVYRLEK